MKWIQHYSDAGRDEVLSGLCDRFGTEGYGAWWLIVEAIAEQIHDKPRDFAEYSLKKWREICGISAKKLQKMLNFLEKNKKVSVENSEKDGIICLKIRIPKILEIADEYTKKQIAKKQKLEQTPDKLPTTSGETSEKIHLNKIRLNKKRKESTSSPKLKFTDEDMKLVKELETLIKEIDPNHRFAGGRRREKWANTFRLMRRQDHRTAKDIRAVMEAAFGDSFWSTVIQSADGFREHYNQLRAKMLGGKGDGQKTERPAPYH